MDLERFDGKKLLLSEEEWRRRLSDQQYDVLRGHGTEPAFCNSYFDFKKAGVYCCVGCGLPLFQSDEKYDSGTGWPSFLEPIYPENVTYRHDTSYGMERIEVICPRCEGHLGHVFEDGPPPTKKRYCINSAALFFKLR